ncbi:MAG TPA: DUF6113 family protein [Trebonia sp.]|jgi:hypothetical protein|nr:DUF6113 family protein [Trebonia sp.]
MDTPRQPDSRAINAVVYVVLFVFGALQGLIGSFQYSQGPVPLVAIILDVAIFATCVLGGWAMRSLSGALCPAVGWLLASFVMSMGNSQGSVIITATSAGEWYLYGGALASAAGVGATFIRTAYFRPR